MTRRLNEYPATAECPQCGHEVETTLYVRRDGTGTYIYGRHCPECDEAVAMDMSFNQPDEERWKALRAWLIGERISLESQMKRMPPDPTKLARLRGSLQEVVMTLQRMEDLETAGPPEPEVS